jgi:hypothetical protein
MNHGSSDILANEEKKMRRNWLRMFIFGLQLRDIVASRRRKKLPKNWFLRLDGDFDGNFGKLGEFLVGKKIDV